jgi:SAM-dependent methyltransferase
MSCNALYTNLSSYYDLMCADIDYQAQSHTIHRLHQIFGNGGLEHLDIACGTGPHIRHFIDMGYQSCGLDLNQPMLDLAQIRCPEARFWAQDMCTFNIGMQLDLITCFLYSLHYSGNTPNLRSAIKHAASALKAGGVFSFNAVDKDKINNALFITNRAQHDGSDFKFRSAWHYKGEGELQSLSLSIEKTTLDTIELWQDEHPMVAVGFNELKVILEEDFEVFIFEHDYQKLIEWGGQSGNAIFIAVKR